MCVGALWIWSDFLLFLGSEFVLIALLKNASFVSKLLEFVKALLEKLDIHYTAPIQVLQCAILTGDTSVMEAIVENLQKKGVLNNDIILCSIQQVVAHLGSCWLSVNWKRLTDPALKQKRFKQIKCLIEFGKKFENVVDIRQILGKGIDAEFERLIRGTN
jgi:DNA-directed RNA polymerase beta' subunit